MGRKAKLREVRRSWLPPLDEFKVELATDLKVREMIRNVGNPYLKTKGIGFLLTMFKGYTAEPPHWIQLTEENIEKWGLTKREQLDIKKWCRWGRIPIAVLEEGRHFYLFSLSGREEDHSTAFLEPEPA